jgi:hypothetical protein
VGSHRQGKELMMRKLADCQAIMKEDIQNTKDRDDMISEIRKMLDGDYELPAEIKAMGWPVKIVSSAPSEGIQAGIRTFGTIWPTISIMPTNTSGGERERAEAIEDALTWHFRKANHRGMHSPLNQILRSVLIAGAVAMQVRYIPYDLKDKGTARTRAVRRGGDFAYFVYEPETVHPRFSSYGLESVSLAKIMTLAQLEQEYPGNPAIAKLIAKIGSKENEALVKNTTDVAFYETTDYETCTRWADLSTELNGGSSSEIIEQKEHKLDFLPWIYKEAYEPLLKTTVKFNTWEDACLMQSIRFSLMIYTIAQAKLATYTIDGKPPQVNYNDPAQPINLRTGESVDVLPAPQTDPNLAQQSAEHEAIMTRQMNTRVLQAADQIAASMPFATFQSLMQTAFSSLSDQINCAESALAEAQLHSLYWIKKSEMPLEGRRLKDRKIYSGSRSEAMYQRGSTVTIGVGEGMTNIGDPDRLEITVKLHANTNVDRQTRVNEAILLHDRGNDMTWQDAKEAAGLDDIPGDKDGWMEEQFTNARVQAEVNKILAEANQEMVAKIRQQVVQEMDQAQQASQTPSAQEQAMTSQSAFENTEGQGFNPNAGGVSPYSVSPQMTREGVTSRTATGEEVR